MSRRFLSAPGDETVGALLARVGEPLSAIDQGRVFVGRTRVLRPDAAVRVGDPVVVEAAAQTVPEVRVLSEFRDLYAVLKPAGLSTEPDRRGSLSLVERLSVVLGAPVTALHAATRLDAAVSGIVVVARGHIAMRRVAALQREGRIRKRYVALAGGRIEPSSGVWDAPIGAGARGRPVAGGAGARAARTEYRVVRALERRGLPPLLVLGLAPITGRSHQLRIHAALAGAPLVGDAQHGGERRIVRADGTVLSVDRVLLHAGRVDVHGEDGVEWSVSAPAPDELTALFRAAGGDGAALDTALTIPILDAPLPP